MTLPELSEYSENTDNMMPSTLPSEKIGLALKKVLQEATSEGRTTCSLTPCVDMLSTRPEDVWLCVMPQLATPDAAATIQSTLIRAVCREHGILVLLVDCDVKLAKVVCLSDESSKAEEELLDMNFNKVLKTPSACTEDTQIISACDNLAPVMGFPCVLVEYPQDGASKEDEMVAGFCKENLYADTQIEPYIELPD